MLLCLDDDGSAPRSSGTVAERWQQLPETKQLRLKERSRIIFVFLRLDTDLVFKFDLIDNITRTLNELISRGVVT